MNIDDTSAGGLDQVLALLRARWATSAGQSFLVGHHEYVQPGDVYFAVPNANFHGGSVADAVASGASVVVHDHVLPDAQIPAGVARIPVVNALVAFRRAAAEWRRRYTIPIVAIGGSAGKTTTTALTAAALSSRQVLSTVGNQNGFWGTPTTLSRLTRAHDVAVVEIGIDGPGAMADHHALVQPTVALLTSLGPEHLDGLGSLETVIAEEAELLRATVASGNTVLINRTDPAIACVGKDLVGPGRVITYQLVDAPDRKPAGDGVVGWRDEHRHLCVSGFGLENVAFDCPLPGRHNAVNLLAAIIAARTLGLDAREISNGLRGFSLAERGRSEIIRCDNDVIVVCDYFNANPVSTSAAIHMLANIDHELGITSARRFFCLGDMGGLGDLSAQHHRDLAREFRRWTPEYLLLLGAASRVLHDELEQDFAGTVLHFETHGAMAHYVLTHQRPRDVVLIKGGGPSKMEQMWSEMLRCGSFAVRTA